MVLADGDNLIARARLTASRGDRRLDTENGYAFRFVDGKLAEGQVFLSDPDQVEAFWAWRVAEDRRRGPGAAAPAPPLRYRRRPFTGACQGRMMWLSPNSCQR